ncbi:MAG: hypothetical protein P9L99_12970 [Candidatus Lernaella stagnicola]|nr:hypothetical protein [Candidatus Lernaella stagnicola]
MSRGEKILLGALSIWLFIFFFGMFTVIALAAVIALARIQKGRVATCVADPPGRYNEN